KTFDGDGRAVADLGGRDVATSLALTSGKAVLAASSTNSAGVADGALARFLTTDGPPGSSPARSTTTMTASAPSVVYGRPLTLTATVGVPSGSATGLVTFKDGTTVLGMVALSGGRASYSTSGLAVGSHNLTAYYNGSSGIAGSTSAACAVTVSPSTAKSTAT